MEASASIISACLPGAGLLPLFRLPSTDWPKQNMAPRYRPSDGSKRPSLGCTWGRSDESSPGYGACSQRQTRLPRQLPIVGIVHEHQGRTHYRKLRRGGYPLGSGGIESSNNSFVIAAQALGGLVVRGQRRPDVGTALSEYNSTLGQVFVQFQQRQHTHKNDLMLPT